MIKTWINKYLKKEGTEAFNDIEGWRTYYFDLILFLACILLPIALAVNLSTYIEENRWGTLIFQVGIFFFLAILFFIRNPLVRWGMFFFFLYATVITFFISLGPFYARPGWLVLCTVTAALLFGVPAAVASVGLNAILLLVLYYFIGPHLQSWATAYTEPDLKWIIFTVNISFVSLVASVPVSLLLRRLNTSFQHEQDMHQQLLNESESQRETNAILSNEIAERKRIEGELKESQKSYRLLAENVRDVMWIFDLNLDYAFVTPSVQRLRGYTVEEALKQTIDQILTPESYQKAKAILDREIALEFSGKRHGPEWSLTTELEMVRKDGSTVWTEATMNMVYHEDGEPTGIIGVTRDITERKRTEKALTESKNYLDRIINSVADPIFVKDRQHRWVLLNDAMCNFMGHNREELIVKSDYDFFPKSEADTFWEKDEAVFNSGKENINEEKFTDVKGVVHTIVTKKTFYTDDKGEKFIVGIIRDITGRKQVEGIIRKSEERYRTIFESTATANIIVAEDTTILLANSNFERMTGYSRSELEGKMSWTSLVVDEDLERAKMNHRMRREKPGSAANSYELRCVNRQGQIRDLYMSVAVIPDTQESVTSLIDISERKQAEEDLRRSEERYRTMFEHTGNASVLFGEDTTLLLVNSNFEKLSGYSKKELEGKMSWTAFVDKEDLERMRQYHEMRRNEQGSVPDSYEFGFINRCGEKKDIFLNIALIPGTKVSVCSLIDITERKKAAEEKKRLEDQLTQAQKMESIGTLAGGIAHDFNNILTAIIGYSELALDDVSDPEKAKTEIREVIKAGDRAKNLVSQILTFSRKTETTYSPLELPTLIKESLKMLRSVIPATIEIRRGIIKSGLVMVDPTQIHQLMMNLCTNAAHAMDETGGVLSVSLHKDNIDAEIASDLEVSPGPYLRLTVSDTGHGMTPEVMERIFEPYFTTKELGRGTGLGLSVVHGIVKSHGGAIICKSASGEGTTFDIYLPELVLETKAPESTKEESLPRGTERILYIDDEPALANLAEKMLSKLGYDVTTLTSSLEALNIFKSRADKFDLVITDMTMPGMTGDTLAQKLMEIRPDIPVILCTGYSEHVSGEGAKKIGIRKFVMKPLEMKVLAKAIRKVLDDK